MHFRSATTLAIAALFATPSAQPMSFGRAPGTALLGSPLNFAVPVRLEPGETLGPDCVAAEVQIGDRRVQPSELRVRVEPGAAPSERIVRVTAPIAVDEPVLAVTVHAGCTGRLSRRFTTLVDPPGANLPAVVPLVVAEAQPVSPALDAMQATPIAPATPGAQGATESRAERVLPRPRREVARAARPQRPARPPRALAAAPEQPAQAAPEAAAPRQARRSAMARANPAPAAVAGGGAARLKLEAADPTDFPPRRAGAAASAPPLSPVLGDLLMASEAASAAAARVQALERSVEALQAESKANRELMAQMRSRLAEGEFWARMAPWMGVALALVSGLALLLGLGLRRSRAEQRQWWNQAGGQPADAAAAGAPLAPAVAAGAPAAAPAAPAPLVPDLPGDVVSLDNPPTMPMAEPAAGPAPAPARDELAPFETLVLPGAAVTDSGLPPRAVAIDELIDLEQQADFFIALGQEDSAVDLLVGHIRGSGGTSPMAYLKLLEIYRRKGDLDSYERTRTRFNHRFNAMAPEWGADLHEGRSLEAYPQVLERLCQAWPNALDALVDLESLMFRRDGGELFDLPAYRELLFLLALARDNLDREGGRPDQGVDVLLPLGDPGELLTGPAPLSFEAVELPAAAEPPGFTLEVPQPQAAGDLDLNLSSGPMPITELPAEPAVRVIDTDLDLKLSDDPPAPGSPSRR